MFNRRDKVVSLMRFLLFADSQFEIHILIIAMLLISLRTSDAVQVSLNFKNWLNLFSACLHVEFTLWVSTQFCDKTFVAYRKIFVRRTSDTGERCTRWWQSCSERGLSAIAKTNKMRLKMHTSVEASGEQAGQCGMLMHSIFSEVSPDNDLAKLKICNDSNGSNDSTQITAVAWWSPSWNEPATNFAPTSHQLRIMSLNLEEV